MSRPLLRLLCEFGRSSDFVNSPHVSGLALLLMGQEGRLSPSALADRLKALAIPNAIGGVFPNTANLLASNGFQI